MKRTARWSGLLILLALPIQADVTQATLSAPAATGVARLELTPEVYAAASHPDLSELRFYNEAQEPLAWSWLPEGAGVVPVEPWRLTGRPGAVDGDWTYDLPVALAPRVRAVSAELPLANSVLPLTLGRYGPAVASSPVRPFWSHAELTFYRLDHAGGERRSGALGLAPLADTPWVLRPQAALPVTAMPVLLLHWQPRALVLNLRGRAPFVLEIGHQGRGQVVAPGAAQPMDQVAPGFSLEELRNLPAAVIVEVRHRVAPAGADSRVVVEADPAELAARQRRWLLWAVLSGGLLLLAALSWRLYTQTQRSDNDGATKP